MIADGVILVSVDGMRPDGLVQSGAPNARELMARGAYTLAARSVMPSVTLPAHTSMVRGVTPERHGITTNTWTPMARPVPSVLETAHQAGLRTASFYSWEELRDLAAPGTLDYCYYSRNALSVDSAKDLEIAGACAEYLRRHEPQLVFVHLDVTDGAGHRFGWMSKEYLAAIRKADEALGLIIQALREQGRLERTAVIFTSDHGGHAQSHGTDMPEDMTLPWLIAGAGVRRGHELKGPVHITDTAATIAHLLGLPLHRDWTGKPVLEALVAEGSRSA